MSSTGSWLPGSTGSPSAFVAPARVHDVHDDVRVREFVEELVAEAAALVSSRHESSHVQQFNGNVALPVVAVLVPAALLAGETRALRAGVGDAAVRVDRGERVVRDVHLRASRRGVERGLAGVWLPGKRDREHTNR